MLDPWIASVIGGGIAVICAATLRRWHRARENRRRNYAAIKPPIDVRRRIL